MVKWQLFQPKILFIFRVLISVTFVYASWHKILAPTEFAKQVALYDLLPVAMVVPFSYSLPMMEIICGLLIWAPKMKIAANYGNAIMMVMFMIAISFALITGKEINCGCFSNSDPIGIRKLIIDLGILLIIIYCLKFDLLKESHRKV